MRKFMVAALAALSLSACAGFATDPGPITSPAPLTQTAVDEQALTAAYASFDVLLTAIDGLRDVGVLVPCSPKALKVKDLIEKAQRGLNAARDVRAGLSTEDPAAALDSATAAFREIAALLKEV
jgi:hypothetical protein